MPDDRLTLSRPLRRRDALIAVALLCAAMAVALWRSDIGHFPDTGGDSASSGGTPPPTAKKTEVADRPRSR